MIGVEEGERGGSWGDIKRGGVAQWSCKVGGGGCTGYGVTGMGIQGSP